MALALALIAACAGRPDPVRIESEGVRYAVEADGLRYEFHAVLGWETLRAPDSAAPDRNLLAERAADAARLRCVLEESQGVRSLEELREPHRAVIESLRRLGYL